MLQEQQKTNTLPLALEEEEEKDESAGYECVCERVCVSMYQASRMLEITLLKIL